MSVSLAQARVQPGRPVRVPRAVQHCKRVRDVNERMKTRKAAQRAEELTGFRIHLTVFVLVNMLLIAVNWATSPDQWWAQWPLLGWGIGILAHGLAISSTVQQRTSRMHLRRIRAIRNSMYPQT